MLDVVEINGQLETKWGLKIPKNYQGNIYHWNKGLFSTSYEAIRAIIELNSNNIPLFYEQEENWNLKNIYFQRYQKQRDFISQKFIPLLQLTDTLLEIGSADGDFTFLMAKYVKSVEAYEYSSKLLETSKKNARNIGVSNINFWQGDICKLQFDKKFNAISCMGVLCYCLDWNDTQKIFEKLYDICVGGGYMVYKDNVNTSNQDYYFFGRRIDYWMVARSKVKLMRLFEKVGFKIIEEKTIDKEILNIKDDKEQKFLESFMCVFKKD